MTINPPPPRRRLPGDVHRTDLNAGLRIDHAGEYGAQRIYAGQLAVLKQAACAPELRHMAAQEQIHLDMFNRLLPQYRVRPTALMPLWHVGGWLMGAATAAFGARAAMACTVAVESVITDHYTQQLHHPALDGSLRPVIQKFRDEELEHHAIGLAHDAENTPFYEMVTTAIRGICKGAIWLSARF